MLRRLGLIKRAAHPVFVIGKHRQHCMDYTADFCVDKN
jgi:hypothetical protein